MTPDFRILADSADITSAIRSRLLSLSVTDAAGTESDTVEIALDDRGGTIALPRTGAELAVSIGYREAGVMAMGRYVVDELSLSGPPLALVIRGHAADLRQGLKKPRTRPWENLNIEGIVASIAGEHGYQAKVAAALAAEVVPHLDQVDESDLHFLTRLARDRGAIAKPAGGLLLFVPEGEAKSAGGKDLPAVSLAAGQISRWEVTVAERGKYPAVTAKWFDPGSASEQTVTAGAGEPVFTLGRRYPDQATAASAAKARLSAFARGVATLRLTCPGNPRLAAESRLTLSGLRPGVDGEWSVRRVAHRLDGGGYSCEIEAETPKEDPA